MKPVEPRGSVQSEEFGEGGGGVGGACYEAFLWPPLLSLLPAAAASQVAGAVGGGRMEGRVGRTQLTVAKH